MSSKLTDVWSLSVTSGYCQKHVTALRYTLYLLVSFVFISPVGMIKWETFHNRDQNFFII